MHGWGLCGKNGKNGSEEERKKKESMTTWHGIGWFFLLS